MKQTSFDLRTLATRAAQGAGFDIAQAETFGRAAVRHVTQNRDSAAILDALRSSRDSPILRLPLMLDDMIAACAALGGTAELTLNPADAALAPSYAELLPVRLRECNVIPGPDQPRLRVTTDAAHRSEVDLPALVAAPDALQDRLKRIAGLDSSPRGTRP